MSRVRVKYQATNVPPIDEHPIRDNSRGKKPPKAHSAANCPLCRAEGHGDEPGCGHREMLEYDGQTQRKLIPYWQVKSEQGRPKRSNTEGQCCQNEACYYRAVTDSTIHALVFDGKRSLAALAEGLSVNATARVFEHGWQTIQRWSDRGADHMSKLHELMFRGLEAVSVELDELRTRIKGQADAVWVWVAFEAKSKLRLATQIGARTQNNAHLLIHKLKQTLAEHCVPVFSSECAASPCGTG